MFRIEYVWVGEGGDPLTKLFQITLTKCDKVRFKSLSCYKVMVWFRGEGDNMEHPV